MTKKRRYGLKSKYVNIDLIKDEMNWFYDKVETSTKWVMENNIIPKGRKIEAERRLNRIQQDKSEFDHEYEQYHMIRVNDGDVRIILTGIRKDLLDYEQSSVEPLYLTVGELKQLREKASSCLSKFKSKFLKKAQNSGTI